jgi:adenylate cyclase
MAKQRYTTPQEEWHDFLSGTHPHLQHRSPLRFIPSSPRCKLCSAPFGSPGSLILRRYGYTPWEKNPKLCGRCFKGLETHAKLCPSASEDREVVGAEVEATMLFADVRGSSKLARQMPVFDFTRLMNRFYKVSSEVLIEADAIVEKFVGDEVVGLFLPFLAGKEHARRAVEAAEGLLRATGHGSADTPWVPLGVGVHTGTSFVGIVGTKGASDFTALGDPVNIAAHLASQAAIGEILVTDEVAAAAAFQEAGLERRHVSLKGHPVEALVLTMSGARAASG